MALHLSRIIRSSTYFIQECMVRVDFKERNKPNESGFIKCSKKKGKTEKLPFLKFVKR